MGDVPYTAEFYADRGRSRAAAEVIVPLLFELIRPRSVLDVGCGTGQFLAVVRGLGVRDAEGVDGPWVEESQLEIPPDAFTAADLEEPLTLERRFDLVLSLEVGEHLGERTATTFVASLCGLAPVVAFSAAIPGQGGTHHVNEQWPGYWVELFREHGYRGFDPIRRLIWDDERVAWWYRQNIALFVEEQHLEEDAALSTRLAGVPAGVPALVHPELFSATAFEDAGCSRSPRRQDPSTADGPCCS